MIGKGWVLIAVVLVALLGIQVVAAGAATRTRIEPPTRTSSFYLHGSGKFGVEVTAKSSGNENAPKVTVQAEKARYKSERVAVAYSVEGRWLADGGFAAKLPGLGKIAVRFEAIRSHQVRVLDNCKGPLQVQRKGIFRGTIGFRGQAGFTVVHGKSAPGFVKETFRQTCREKVYEPSPGEAALGPQTPAVFAAGPSTGGSVHFSAAGSPAAEPPVSSGGIPTVAFTATYLGSRGPVEVVAVADANTGSYLWHVPGWPAALTDATAEPPAPFTGVGVFHLESPMAASWSGDLGVDLPGIGPVPLTGPGIAAQLCQGFTCSGPPLPPAE